MSTIKYKFSPSKLTVGSAGGARVSGDSYTVGGWVTTFGGPPDHYGDIVHENALDRFFEERGNRLIGFSGHDPQQMIGWHQLKKVTSRGVWSDFTFLKGITRAEEDLIRVKSGAMAFSIGYMTNKEEFRGGVRWLLDIELAEASVVAIPANPRATIEERADSFDADTQAALALQRLALNLRSTTESLRTSLAERACARVEQSVQLAGARLHRLVKRLS